MFENLKWEEAKKIIEANKDNELIFLNFTTQWCGDCKMMRPIVEEIAKEYEGNHRIRFINVDAEEAQLFRVPNTKWQVLKVPTMMLLQGQTIQEKAYEYVPFQILNNWILKKIS
ncbi:thioredoxin family protein [Mycoplasma sp. 2045]|uniref:thioredoxin family protein n=1 Tax=unclassified Mycoplasma TaxID=2683645 RepID=UPI00211CCA5B|nr:MULTISPECIES: thioredoxin family protein [unclassified Mycoplasma]MEA4134563.1 thioredoxin family protein [Mycoplasma sp. 2704]MEA4206358.1 thioredoxin family protein [Mycoplasma sp. 1199]MEA4333700.1 thioredoxin family protein [Mycoplasma sp. 1232]UUM20489.1 thioredoxin family protein [Mycoplasma sp. 2045]